MNTMNTMRTTPTSLYTVRHSCGQGGRHRGREGLGKGEHRMLTIDGFHFVRNCGRGIVTEPRTDVYIRRTGHEDTGEYRCFLFNTASCYTEYQQTWCRIDILYETIRMKGVVSTRHLAIGVEPPLVCWSCSLWGQRCRSKPVVGWLR